MLNIQSIKNKNNIFIKKCKEKKRKTKKILQKMKIKNGNKQDKYKMIKKTNIKKTCFLQKKKAKNYNFITTTFPLQ